MGIKKEIIISAAVSIIVSLLIVFLLVDFKKEGYINMVKLNEQFELKLTLQKELDTKISGAKQELDNLKLEMQRIYNDSSLIGEERFVTIKELQTNIETKTYSFAQKEQELTRKYNEQIWTQLNVYLTDFGKEKDLDVLFGAAKQGTILYGSATYDLTEECIAYVNSKYRGE